MIVRFIIVAFFSLATLPVFNFWANPDLIREINIRTVKVLFSLDNVMSKVNPFLIHYGISTRPNSVVVGYDKWLFLGDGYSSTISNNRSGVNNSDVIRQSNRIVNSVGKWEAFYKAHGVKNFSIILGPNKSTVYSDKLPLWARSPDYSLSHHLYNNPVYINSIDRLIASRDIAEPYYKTDTHWNKYGASIAFRNYVEKLGNDFHINLPPISWREVSHINNKQGGDLSRFLRVQNFSDDIEVYTKFVKDMEHQVTSYYDGNLVYAGQQDNYGGNHELNLITNEHALNDTKILWLSDSFGDALLPYMTTTFSHVLKQHWSHVVGKGKVSELIKSWKPDLVLYTVVERSSLEDAFTVEPPAYSYQGLKLSSISPLSLLRTHSLSKESLDSFKVSGDNPLLIYNSSDLDSEKLSNYYLQFGYVCNDINTVDSAVKIFLRNNKADFAESKSMIVNIKKGLNQIPLSSIESKGIINSFRLDFSKCNDFNLRGLYIGEVEL